MRWCRIADDNEARPLVREELTDPQVLARLIQYADIVRGAIDKGTGDVLRTAGFRNSSDWYGLGQNLQFNWDDAPIGWLGVDPAPVVQV